MSEDSHQLESSSENVVERLPNPFKNVRGLFFLTTIIGLVIGVGLQFGFGWTAPLVGIPTCVYCGWHDWELAAALRKRLFWLAMLCFLVSLFLPAVIVMGPVAGHQAFSATFGLAWGLVFEGGDGELKAYLLYPATAVANMIFLTAIIWIWWPRSRRMTNDMMVATATLCWLFGPWLEPLVGYFLWCCSFLVLVIAGGMRKRTILAIVFAVAAYICVFAYDASSGP